MKQLIVKRIIFSIVGIATAIGAIGYIYTYSQGARASTAVASVVGTANPTIIARGSTTVVSYRFDVANPTTNVLDGVDLRLTYSNNLQYVSYTVTDNYLDSILIEETTTPGSLRLMLGSLKTGDARKSTATINLTFRGAEFGTGTVTATTQSLVSGTARTTVSPKAFSVAQNVPVTFTVNAGPTITLPPPTNTPVVPTNTPVPPSVTGVVSPTTVPVSPSLTPIISPTAPQRDCRLQPQGDANCDGVVNVVDYVGWRNYFLGIDFPQKSLFNPNFNGSGTECEDAKNQQSAYCLTDLQIWTTTVTK